MSSKDDNEVYNTLMSSKEDDEMDNTLMSSKEDNEHDKRLMSSKDGDDETMNQNNNIIKQSIDSLDKINDESTSFEDQIKSIKKVQSLNEYYFIIDYGDKELEFKIFKLKLA